MSKATDYLRYPKCSCLQEAEDCLYFFSLKQRSGDLRPTCQHKDRQKDKDVCLPSMRVSRIEHGLGKPAVIDV